MFGGLAAAPGDRVLFATLDGTVVTLDPAGGGVLDQFALYPCGPLRARFTACAVDADGTILVADARNHRVRRFRADGLPVARYGGQRNPGMRLHDEGGVLDEPYSVVPHRGDVVVACGGGDLRHGVQRFARDGGYLTSLARGGDPLARWRRPRGLALVQGSLWIAEAGSGRIRVHAAAGRHMGEIDLPEDLGRPVRLADDGYGGVLVVTAAEGGAPGLVRLDRDGEASELVVLAGKAPGKVDCPFDVAVLSDGRFVVADLPSGVTDDARVQLFGAGGTLERVLVEGAEDLAAQLAAFAATLEEGGGDGAEALYRRARARHFLGGEAEGRAETAAALYRRALAAEPGHLLAHVGLATLLHRELGDFEAAEAEYRLAIAAGGPEAELLARVAECRHDRGDLDGAIEILKFAVELREPPENAHERIEELADYWLERAGGSDKSVR